MNHNVTARIRTSEGGERRSPTRRSSPRDEWRLLERFATEAQNLAGNGILSKKGRLAYSLQGDEQGTSFEPVEMPDPDAFSVHCCTRCAPSC